MRFGLRPESNCPNCPEQNETIMHKVRDCSKALEAWRQLEGAKNILGLKTLTDLSIENLIGSKDCTGKIELALQAELIHRLTSRNIAYDPKVMVKVVIKFVSFNERLNETLKGKFDDLLRNW